MTAARIVVRGATLAVTRRTNYRKAFLAPWHPKVQEICLYALAYAQHMTGVALHHATWVIDHHHLNLTPSEPNFGLFAWHFHHDVSCALNTLLANERYDAPGQLFDGRPTHGMRCLTAEAEAAALVYGHVNPVAAGLVARPEDMPGTVIDFGHWKTGGFAVKRPDVYFTEQRPEELHLALTPPPLLMQAFDCDLDALVHRMRRLTEGALQDIHEERKGRPPLGAEKVQRIHPWNEARTLRETGGKRIPKFKIAARGDDAHELHDAAEDDAQRFACEHEDARRARLAGQMHAFPYGTYGMRVFHNAPVVSNPYGDAVLTAPGPLLEEVLAAKRARTERAKLSCDQSTERPDEPSSSPDARVERVDLAKNVRAAWSEDAAEIVALDEMTIDLGGRRSSRSPMPPVTPPDAPASALPAQADAGGDADAQRPERTAPEVRHRFDRDPDRDPDEHPRRLIIERDRRRGRRRTTKRRGSDPPG